MNSFDVLVVGGGTGGIMTAAQIRRKLPKLTVGLFEPSETHWYQPAWTLVGAGTYDMAATKRKTADYMPKGVTWVKERIGSLQPAQNQVTTESGASYTYRYLVLSPGLVYDLSLLPGLAEALETPYVCSNYMDPEKTWDVLQNFKGGNAVFTQASTPIKCGGAPQKIMYMAEDYFRRRGIRDKTNVVFATPGGVIFGVEAFARTLNQIIARRDIFFKPHYAPISMDPAARTITFRYNTASAGNDCMNQKTASLREEVQGDTEMVMPYDMLHLAPPQTAPKFIQDSPLAVAEGVNKGWLEVDIHTLNHPQFSNVFGIGDCAALPTAKTGAALRKQAPVVVEQIRAAEAQTASSATYEGYSSCPLVTGYGKMVLAEFRYDNVRDSDPLLSALVDTTKESRLMWILKKYGLPYLYWNQMLRGKM
jgi:sulfide:quinone oxidoreductase